MINPPSCDIQKKAVSSFFFYIINDYSLFFKPRQTYSDIHFPNMTGFAFAQDISHSYGNGFIVIPENRKETDYGRVQQKRSL